MRWFLFISIAVALTSFTHHHTLAQKSIQKRQIFRDDVKKLTVTKKPVEKAPTVNDYVSGAEKGSKKPALIKPTYSGIEELPLEYDDYFAPSLPGKKPSPNYSSYEEIDDYRPAQPKPLKPYVPKPPPVHKEPVLLAPSPLTTKTAEIYTFDNYYGKPPAVPGMPGKDYPNYASIPPTSFDCLKLKDPYYDLKYPDNEAGCQVFHACHEDGRQDSFLCPLGTIFDFERQTCDWWHSVKCY